MPCSDGRGNEAVHDEVRRLRGLEAALCAVLTAFESQVHPDIFKLITIDEKEAGVTKQFIKSWWEAHKLADIQRREVEDARKRRAEPERVLREKALAKLTTEERTTLGLY